MKCKSCPAEYPEPVVMDGTAYFACDNCGDLHEVTNYCSHTPEEMLEMFEAEYGLRLPHDYIQHAGTSQRWVVKLPECNTRATKYYFGEGFYVIDQFSALNPDDDPSIFDSASLAQEWGLPEKLVLIAGDGHTWLALDYRVSDLSPRVIVMESDEYNYLVVANNFDEFVRSLLPYQSS